VDDGAVHRRVEAAVVAGRHRPAQGLGAITQHQQRVIVLPPRGIARPVAVEETLLLPIAMRLHQGARGAAHHEPRGLVDGEHARRKEHLSRRVVERDLEPVVGLAARPQRPQSGLHAPRRAEQRDRLIDQVRAEVVPEAGAGAGALTPAVAYVRPPPRHLRSTLDDIADEARAHGVTDAEEVAVPAPVLEDRHQQAGSVGGRRQRPRLLERDGERLVDHDVSPGTQRGLCQWRVGVVGCGDDDQRDVVVLNRVAR
jgi:hypothetical protein